MSPLKKIAVFLMMIGEERARRVLALLDDDEIKRLVPEIRKIAVVPEDLQKSIWKEFCALGYEDGMKAIDIVDVVRFSAGGGKIKK